MQPHTKIMYKGAWPRRPVSATGVSVLCLTALPSPSETSHSSCATSEHQMYINRRSFKNAKFWSVAIAPCCIRCGYVRCGCCWNCVAAFCSSEQKGYGDRADGDEAEHLHHEMAAAASRRHAAAWLLSRGVHSSVSASVGLIEPPSLEREHVPGCAEGKLQPSRRKGELPAPNT